MRRIASRVIVTSNVGNSTIRAPIDSAVQLAATGRDASAALLRAMIAAFTGRLGGENRHCVVKLDSWHVLALPLFRRAFPQVPWVFLYRDPIDVMVVDAKNAADFSW